MKAKYFVVLVIIPVLIVSSFVYFSNENASIPVNNNSTLIQETPEPDPTNTPTIAPTPLNQTINAVQSATSPPSERSYRIPSNIGNIEIQNQFFGPVGQAGGVNKDVWRKVAENAWRYFQPDVGVNSATGLPGALIGFPYFTDWDLGVYLQAIIDAQRIGILSTDGEWGANARLEKVISFLETRALNEYGLPFWWYEAGSGLMWADASGQNQINVADTGRLLIALKNVKRYDSALIERVNNLVYQRMNNYTLMWGNITMLVDRINTYDYLVSKGFASFWPEHFSHVPTAIMQKLMTAPQIEAYGVKLPVSKLSCEPLLLSIFDFATHEEGLFNLTKRVYLAHEARYNETGKYVAFSEGNSGYGNFIYEWVVFNDVPEGRTWVIRDTTGSDFYINPIIFSKVAFSFLSLYKTDFAKKMIISIENAIQQPDGPYPDGIDDADPQNVFIVSAVGSNTNGLILSSARWGFYSTK